MKQPWTSVDDVIAVLRKRWASGRYLSDHAAKVAWEPISVPIKAPTAGELLDRFDDVTSWAARFAKESVSSGGRRPRFRVEHRVIRGRNVGANSVPCRVWIDRFDDLSALVGTTDQVRRLEQLLEATRTAVPALVGWVTSRPFEALAVADEWDHVLDTVAWIARRDTASAYLRQLDIPGVDTKFVERHRRLLSTLLTLVLPPERVDDRFTAADFARRFGFRSKPSVTRLRFLSGPSPSVLANDSVADPAQRAARAGIPDSRPGQGRPAWLPVCISELSFRTEELADLDLGADTVFVVENEVTYLAFPTVPGSIVVFGSGFVLGGVRHLPWMDGKDVVYWGDLDTHGFDILDRLRTRFPTTRSILMDEATLLAHRGQWVEEPSPTDRALAHLTKPEAELYRDLVEDRFGTSVRLEQERVRYSLTEAALAPWMS